jgi:hypothetical protein
MAMEGLTECAAGVAGRFQAQEICALSMESRET